MSTQSLIFVVVVFCFILFCLCSSVGITASGYAHF